MPSQRARCSPNSTGHPCRLGCELHWRQVLKYFISLSPIALSQMQSSRIFNFLVLSFCVLTFCKLWREMSKRSLQRNRSLRTLAIQECHVAHRNLSCSKEFTDIMENTASVLVLFGEKEASTNITAIFREIKWTWKIIPHSMGET